MEARQSAARKQPGFARARKYATRAPILLALLVLVGLGLRMALAAAYQPASLNLADSTVYVDMAANELFSDPTRPAGYSIFLRFVHWVWADVDLVVALQYLIGICTGLLLYATVRRIGAPRWVGFAAAGAVLLSFDQIFLEHSLMPEALFTLLVVAVMYACVRSLDEPRQIAGPVTSRIAWVVAAGVLLGLSAWLRPVTAPLAPFLALWMLFALPGGWRPRVGHALLAAGAAGTLLLGYFALNSAHTGHFGFTQSSGWALYSRVAPFADCTRFDPPAGTEALCQRIPEESRPGPDFYGWEPGSPARQLYGGQPRGDEELASFARAAVLAQPLGYLEDVARDMARYFVELTPPPYSGAGYDLVEVDRRAPGFEEQIHAVITSYWADEPLEVRPGIADLANVQDVLRIRTTLLLVALVLTAAAIPLARGRVRSGLTLMLGGSLLGMLVPVATAIYSARYAIPFTGPLVASAGIGVWVAVPWARRFVRAHLPKRKTQSTADVSGALDRWSAGLDEESEFWLRWLRDQGSEWRDDYRLRTDPQAELQPHIRRHLDLPDGSEVRILDVGSGPLTVLGKRWGDRRLHITAVDPLADRYGGLFERVGMEPLVRPVPGDAEHVSEMFPEASFDLVYAQNCLDHGYDPLRSIQQMVAVARENGVVLLEHAIDEGEYMDYEGPHQWNFRAEDERFVIWRPGLWVDAHATLERVADIELEVLPDLRWIRVALRRHRAGEQSA